MTPEQLSNAIVAALTALVESGRLSLADPVPTQVRVERPKVKEHGDYATNIALQVAKKAGMNPREFAEILGGSISRYVRSILGKCSARSVLSAAASPNSSRR